MGGHLTAAIALCPSTASPAGPAPAPDRDVRRYGTLLDRPALGYGLRLVGFVLMFGVTLAVAASRHLLVEKPRLRRRPAP